MGGNQKLFYYAAQISDIWLVDLVIANLLGIILNVGNNAASNG
jgi:hypothetical protein